jgi:hypothetical protein
MTTATLGDMPPTGRPQHPYNVNARLTPAQYAHLLAIAESQDISISESLRLVIDLHQEQTTHPDDVALLVEHATSIEPNSEWALKHDGETRAAENARRELHSDTTLPEA